MDREFVKNAVAEVLKRLAIEPTAPIVQVASAVCYYHPSHERSVVAAVHKSLKVTQ